MVQNVMVLKWSSWLKYTRSVTPPQEDIRGQPLRSNGTIHTEKPSCTGYLAHPFKKV
jgi:hypothetical protein